jgi:outer membrane protein assembly factor BamB
MNLALFAAAILSVTLAPEQRWQGFRGDGSSIADGRSLPITWSDTENVAWRADLVGYGQSSPVVWGDLIAVTSVEGEQKTGLVVAGYDLATGKQRWLLRATGTQGVLDSDMTSRAAPTPAIDAERVYAFFESGNLLAVDHEGRELWKRDIVTDYGPLKSNHGLGSSPVLTRNAVVVLVENDNPSYLVAFEKATGKTLWKTDRSSRISWSTPVVALGGEEHGADDEIVISSNGVLEVISAVDGKLRWQLDGIEGNTVPSPTLAGTRIIVGSSDAGHNMLVNRVIQAPASDASEDRIVWRTRDAAASFGSPLVYGDYVYFINKASASACLSLADGKVAWQQRMPESCWASPLASDGRIYFFGKSGTTTVVRAGPEFEKLAENKLTVDGRIYGVAAVAGKLVLRSGRQLICISGTKS